MNLVLNMDRSNLSNAISDNLAMNLGITNNDVNTSITMHAVLFSVATLPNNIIVKRIGAHRWIPIIMTSWAICTWCHDYSSFMAVRAFTALTEGGFIPSCLVYLSGFYTNRELGPRLAWFWAAQSFSGAVSGLISAGIFRLAGVGGLYGWEWLFLIDGVFTHVVAFIAAFYLVESPGNTKTPLWRRGWFTERERKIAVTRLVRDDLTKKDQAKHVTWADVKISVVDTKMWTHLIISFTGLIFLTPIWTYLPTVIKGSGFSVVDANLLAAPAYLINLSVSIFIAHIAEKYGYMGLFAAFEMFWSMCGLLAMELLPESASRWQLYAAILFTAATPIFHGMHIAWMSSNLAPIGKRTLALGAAIGFGNICAVPGSQIYRTDDAPRYHRGNWILFALQTFTGSMLVFQHFRYKITNMLRERKWNAMTDAQKEDYLATTKHLGSDRLDFRFDI
ncbi:major facilitator superfamily domain-containing protein [Gongronella butleri]|nr:major facilitator superfamily domain-containing protein [Gongronella butleri]